MAYINIPTHVLPSHCLIEEHVVGDEFRSLEVFCPDGFDEMDAYQHLIRGKCGACGGELGEDTQFVVSNVGILMLWCDGQCMSDQLAVGFLQQIEAELVSAIEARGKEDE